MLYLRYSIMVLVPTILAACIYLIQKKQFKKSEEEKKSRFFLWKCFIGILFGILACIFISKGIKIQDETVSSADAIVLSCGLVFGGPSGIIAGCIAGIYRWFFASASVGAFTALCSSLSFVFAGILAMLARKFMFEDKMPGWTMGLFIGLVMEIFHFNLLFILDMDNLDKTLDVLRKVTIPSTVLNSITLAVVIMVITILAGHRIFPNKKSGVTITQTVQVWLLGAVLLALIVSTLFSYSLQALIADMDTQTVMKNTITDVKLNIRDASDENLLRITEEIADEIKENEIESKDDLKALADKYNVDEINKINHDGIIINSTEDKYIGFDMHSGEQSAEFLPLLDGSKRKYVQELKLVSYDHSVYMKYAGVRTADAGAIQVGCSKERFYEDIKERIDIYAVNTHIESQGYVVITDSNFNYESYGKDSDIEYLSNDSGPGIFGKLLSPVDEYTIVKGSILNRDVYCMYTMSEGYYIIAVYPVDEAYFTRNIALYANIFTEVIIFAILFVIIYILIRVIVVNNIFKINNSLAEITGGNLDTVVDVRSSEEFSLLSNDINSTVDTLKRYIAEAASRIDAELQYAKDIQASALPNIEPNFVGRDSFEMYSCMFTAKEVGGDFYDFYYIDDSHLCITIADVSGKGIPAALFMMTSKTMLRNLIESGMSVDEAMTLANNRLCEGNGANMFVTVWAAVLDLSTGHIEYANAGHNHPVVHKKDGSSDFLTCRPGMVLAGIEGVRYKKYEYDLEKGDIIYLYTDGVVEATDSNNELYGNDRLIDIMNSKLNNKEAGKSVVDASDTDAKQGEGLVTMKNLCEAIKDDVDLFVGDAPQFDDITMLALRYK